MHSAIAKQPSLLCQKRKDGLKVRVFDPHIMVFLLAIDMSVFTLQRIPQEFGARLLVDLLELATDLCYSAAEPGSGRIAGYGLWAMLAFQKHLLGQLCGEVPALTKQWFQKRMPKT